MKRFEVPAQFVAKVEAAGGYWIRRDLESDPQHGVQGWILIVEFVPHDQKQNQPLHSERAEFFFTTREAAEKCAGSFTIAESFEGFLALPGPIAIAQDYFCCSFCGRRRKNTERLFRDDSASAAICANCIKEFAASISEK